MAYDQDKEVIIRELGVFPIDSRDSMAFRIGSYGGGQRKLYLVKTWTNKASGEEKTSTARFTREQAKTVSKLMAAFASDDGNWR